MNGDLSTSFQRTFIPIFVGWVITLLAKNHIDVDANLLQAFVTSLYYGVLRALEVKWPKLGVFLGSQKKPAYTDEK